MLRRVASVTLVTMVILLISTTIPIQGASVLKNHGTVNEEKLQQIREMSKAAGAPQVNSDFSQEDICLDEGCLDAALALLNAVNLTVDPCKDFFQFSCGRWILNNPVPGTESRWDSFNVLTNEVNNITQAILNEEQNEEDAVPINQVKVFYQSCLDLEAIEQAGLQPLKDIVETVGGWELLNPPAWNSSFDWVEASAEVRRRTLLSAILYAYVSADLKNTTRGIVYIDQPTFTLPRGILIDPESYPAIISAYRTFIIEVAQELGSVQSEAQLTAGANAIIDFEVELAKISSSDEARSDFERIYNPFSLDAYEDITDQYDPDFKINWKQHLDHLFRSSGVSISNSEEIVVHELEYVEKLIPILKNTDPITIANYIGWRLVSGLVPDTTAPGITSHTLFWKNISHQILKYFFVLGFSDVTCASTASVVFGMAISVKYIEAVFDQDAKREVELLVENLRVSFKEMVNEADWMEDESKMEAIAKVDTIRSLMAYPDWLENKTAVEAYYEGLELSNTYFASQLNLALYTTDKELRVLGQLIDRDQWILTPAVVNAMYIPQLNSITFPAGILQPPFFGKLRPKSQNYGGIGMVIGHEITHGFDNRGSQFDKNGNLQNWWDNVTKEEYDKRAQCMSDQYSGFYVEAVDMYVNGELTLGENIGDNGGLRESYRAYQKYVEENGPEGRLPGLEHLSTNQLFFLGYANVWCESITLEGLVNQILTDPHSPSEFRVKGPLRNNHEFALAYDCPVDSDGMNPPEEDKCTVW